ncbi:DUF4253 domain-containing protein [Shewanella submarina]|uniref:DUF4253 domain-containing protein n=1 Tax=Shewanella submarina TaxID=2016376 RepID=A0ABV7G5M6_9GAMM|nr:DUF4253 domain-containing protein [Shewanella submarina]MCL1038517.1 DUF4253 domain-containing protein [Shewanella submarina]
MYDINQLEYKSAGLCPTYVAHRILNLDEYLAVFQALANKHPEARILCTLDDQNQAGYTSGHCIDANDLDEVLQSDLTQIDRLRWQEEGVTLEQWLDPDYPVYDKLNYQFYYQASHFPFRLRNIESRVDMEAGFSRFTERSGGFWMDETLYTLSELRNNYREDDNSPALDSRNPPEFSVVPVAHAYQTIACSPQNYWADALKPYDIYYIARYLEDNFDIQLVAIGASFMGFWIPQPLTQAQNSAIAATIMKVYHKGIAEGYEANLAEQISQRLNGEQVFFLIHT